MKKRAEDNELIEGCLKRDRKYQKMLFEQYYSDMMAVCLRYSKDEDDAQDVLQQGFIKVFSKIEMFNSDGSFRGWIQSIMVRTAIDHYRRHRRDIKTIVPENENYDEGEDAVVNSQLAADEIMKVIQSLPDMQRTVFNLFAIEGYSHKDIAHELGLTEGTSKWYLCEARKTLKKLLAPVYGEKMKEYAA